MKKILILLLAAIVLFSSVSLAEDLSSLSDDELSDLYMRVTEEMSVRGVTVGETEENAVTRVTGSGKETVPDDTVLYYNPTGGQYYHADPNCKCVHEKYLPLSGTFTYAELGNDAYRILQPCEVCGAPALRESRTLSMSFRDTVEAAGESVSVGGDIDYLAAVMEKDGKYIRVVTLLDDHARKLYMAAMAPDASGDAFETFNAYAWSLPVSYTEEITA